MKQVQYQNGETGYERRALKHPCGIEYELSGFRTIRATVTPVPACTEEAGHPRELWQDDQRARCLRKHES